MATQTQGRAVQAVALAHRFRTGRRAVWAMQRWARDRRPHLLTVLEEGQELEEETGRPVGISCTTLIADALANLSTRADQIACVER